MPAITRWDLIQGFKG